VTTGRSLFSLFLPAFAAVPQYLGHISVDLLSLTEPDKVLGPRLSSLKGVWFFQNGLSERTC